MLVWSDKTNIMGTHDDETRDFFRDTRVNCGLIPREIATKELTDVLQNQFSSGTYSHHQKSVICDTKLHHNSQRGLVAFVGGLDLTNGRWDTPDHELFKTMHNEHLEDFYQSNAPSIPATQVCAIINRLSVTYEIFTNNN